MALMETDQKFGSVYERRLNLMLQLDNLPSLHSALFFLINWSGQSTHQQIVTISSNQSLRAETGRLRRPAGDQRSPLVFILEIDSNNRQSESSSSGHGLSSGLTPAQIRAQILGSQHHTVHGSSQVVVGGNLFGTNKNNKEKAKRPSLFTAFTQLPQKLKGKKFTVTNTGPLPTSTTLDFDERLEQIEEHASPTSPTRCSSSSRIRSTSTGNDSPSNDRESDGKAQQKQPYPTSLSARNQLSVNTLFGSGQLVSKYTNRRRFIVQPFASQKNMETVAPSSGTDTLVVGTRLQPAVSPRTLVLRSRQTGTAEPWEISKIISDSPECVYSIFMKSHRCYDLIPTSTKLVVFDTQLPVRKAFFALVYNGVRAAPLWNSELQRFVGMLTITDFIAILHKYYRSGQPGGIKELEQHKIVTWREVMLGAERSKTHLISIDPTESLYKAVQILCANHVHRLPVLDRKSGNIAYILTHKRLIKYLYLYIYDLPKPAFLEKTPKELGIGSWGDITTVRPDTSLIKVLSIFLEQRISAVPIVDEDGRVIDIYAKFDVITLAADQAYNDLEVTVSDALKHRSGWFEGVRSCLDTDSLSTVIETLVKAEIHRMLITDAEKRVVGIVSLSDILKHLVLDHAPTEAVKHKLSDIMLADRMEDAEPKPKEPVITETGDDNIKNDIVTINE